MGKNKSDWLSSARAADATVEECAKCGGTGSTGAKNSKGETIVCPSCGGFGY